MAVSVVIDHFGLMGFPEKPVSLARLVGVALIIGGMVITQIAKTKAEGSNGKSATKTPLEPLRISPLRSGQQGVSRPR